ncbi:MAG TPA: hypothetical protein VNQ76_15780 [Planctomicrobium sp.]|nr:hypothetical protein [Planctomicrobium sp.]
MIRQLLNDEAGFIVSAELVLVSTILVIGLIVGLSQVQYAVVEELNDVARAIGNLNQSYGYTGFTAVKTGGAWKSFTRGSGFGDTTDACDGANCDSTLVACEGPFKEGVGNP